MQERLSRLLGYLDRPVYSYVCPDDNGPYHARLVQENLTARVISSGSSSGSTSGSTSGSGSGSGLSETRPLYALVKCSSGSGSTTSSSDEWGSLIQFSEATQSGVDNEHRLARLVQQDLLDRPLYAVENPCCVLGSASGSGSTSGSSGSGSASGSASGSLSGSASGSISGSLSGSISGSIASGPSGSTSTSGPASGSASGSGGRTIPIDCCPYALPETLYATVTGWGSITLTYTDTPPAGCAPDCLNGWYGARLLSCGQVLYIQYQTTCTFTYSCDGVNWLAVGRPIIGSVFDCGPPFVDGVFTFSMMDINAGCPLDGSCGALVQVTISS